MDGTTKGAEDSLAPDKRTEMPNGICRSRIYDRPCNNKDEATVKRYSFQQYFTIYQVAEGEQLDRPQYHR